MKTGSRLPEANGDHPPDSDEHFRESDEGLADEADALQVLEQMGEGLLEQGDVDAAIEAYERAVVAAREASHKTAEARARGRLGDALSKAGRPRQAILHHRAALDAAHDTEDTAGEARWLGALALDHSEIGDYEAAIRLYNDSIDAAHDMGDRRLAASMLDDLGRLMRLTGRLEDAADCFQEALTLSTALGNKRAAARQCASLGLVLQLLEQDDEARDCYRRCPVEHDTNAQVTCLLGSALLDLAAGYEKEGNEALRSAAELCEQAPDDPRALYALTLAHLAAGHAETAVETAQQALEACSTSAVLRAAREELGLVRRAVPEAPGLDEVEALFAEAPVATEQTRPFGDGETLVTTTRGTHAATSAELEALRDGRDDFEVWMDEASGEVSQEGLGDVSFADRHDLLRLLLHLVKNAGREFTGMELQRELWDHDGAEDDDDPQAVRDDVQALRELIEPDPHHPRYVLKSRARFGRRGGYYFNPAVGFCLVHA